MYCCFTILQRHPRPKQGLHPQAKAEAKTPKCLSLLEINLADLAIFTARCYVSAVLAMGLCLSVRHKSEFY